MHVGFRIDGLGGVGWRWRDTGVLLVVAGPTRVRPPSALEDGALLLGPCPHGHKCNVQCPAEKISQRLSILWRKGKAALVSPGSFANIYFPRSLREDILSVHGTIGGRSGTTRMCDTYKCASSSPLEVPGQSILLNLQSSSVAQSTDMNAHASPSPVLAPAFQLT